MVDLLPDGRAEVRAAPGGGWDAFFGSLKRKSQAPLTVEEINKAAADGWAGLP